MTSPRAVQAVEKAIELVYVPTSSSSFDSSSSVSDEKIPPIIKFLQLPIFVVGAATQKAAEAIFGAILDKNRSSSSSISTKLSTPPPSASDFDAVLHFLGSESGNARNLVEFIIDRFSLNSRSEKGEVKGSEGK